MKHNANGGTDADAEASAATNGHHGYAADLSDLPADFGKAPPPDKPGRDVFAKTTPVKLTEDARFGSPEVANTASGVYVAERAVARGTLTRGTAGYDTVAALGSVQMSNARSTGLVDRDHNPSQADVARWHAEHGQEWGPWKPETPATVDLAGLKAATKGIDPARKIALTTIDALAAEGAPWAKKAAAKAVADNLDTAVKGAPHSFTLSELHTYYGGRRGWAAADDDRDPAGELAAAARVGGGREPTRPGHRP